MNASKSGMTLVEVMVAMGLAIVLSLGLAQIMTFTARAVKSSSLSGDWINLQQTIRLALSDPQQCALMMSSIPNNRTANLTSPTVLRSLPALELFNPGAATPTVVSTLLRKAQPPLNGLVAETIDVVVAPGNTTQTISIDGVPSFIDTVQLNLVVNKTLPGAAASTERFVGSTRLTSGSGSGNAITFSIVRRRDTGQFTGCFGSLNASEQVCRDLGGIPAPNGIQGNPNIRCAIRPIAFSGPQNFPAGGPATTAAGMVLQLSPSTPGEIRQDDSAIGVDSSGPQVWFNIGGNDGANFAWHHRSSSGPVNDFDPLLLQARSSRGLFVGNTPPSAEYGTTLTIGNPSDGARIGHSSLRLGNVGTGEGIRSIRDPAAANLFGLELFTNDRTRLVIDREGAVSIPFGFGANAPARLALGNPLGGGAFPAEVSVVRDGFGQPQLTVGSSPSSLVFDNGNRTVSLNSKTLSALGPGISSLISLNVDDVRTLQLNNNRIDLGQAGVANASVVINWPTTINVPPGGGRGNVPHRCRMKADRPPVCDSGGANQNCTIMCDPGEIAISGGGQCDRRMVLTRSIAVDARGVEVVSGSEPNGWRITCHQGNTGSEAAEAMTVYCCAL